MRPLPAPRGLDRMMKVLMASTALASAFGAASARAQNLPTGGTVASGKATLTQSGNTLTINQTTRNAVINYNGFSVGAGNTVDFVQPNSQSLTLNRVTGATPSTIAGQIDANGQVYLINPNGIAITKTGVVNVGGGFVASTLNISDEDAKRRKKQFAGNGASATVSKAGAITIGPGGYAALIGGQVRNSGTIAAPMGKVGLGSGEAATLDVSGDGFLQVAVPTQAGGKAALIQDKGTISAVGGTVVISAATARAAARNAVNISGAIDAHSVSGHDGAIVIGGGAGGKVKVSGRLSTASSSAGGGSITITGENIKLKGAALDASGATGGGTILIGGGLHGAGPLPQADSVTIDAATAVIADATLTGAGGTVAIWSDGATSAHGLVSATGGPNGGDGGTIETSGQTVDLTGITVRAGATAGKAGVWLVDPTDLIIDSAAATAIDTALAADTSVTLTTSANGVSGPAGTTGATASGPGDIDVNAPLSWSTGATLTLSAYNSIAVNAPITLSGAGTLQLLASSALTIDAAVNVNGGGTVALGYDSSSATNLSFGLTGSGFTGSLTFASGQTGQALSINGTPYTLLYKLAETGSTGADSGTDDIAGIDNAGDSGNYALATNVDGSGTTFTAPPVGFASNGFAGSFEGLGHTIAGLTINDSNGVDVGLFSQQSGGVIRDVGLVGGTVSGHTTVGDLVGYQNNSSIFNVYATGAVSGGLTAYELGGLVGYQSNSSITNAYATGSVSGGSSANTLGGLVGDQYSSSITNAYATGAVSGGSFATTLGGLVGYQDRSSITNAYATGAVSGATYSDDLGGLVGDQYSGSITNAYATGAVSGATYSDNLGGLVGFQNNGSITSAFATGAVSAGSNARTLGGLVGIQISGGSITNAFATGAVSGASDAMQLGGLVGFQNNSSITNAYSTGAVSGGSGANELGGLVGFQVSGSITHAVATGAVSGGSGSGALGGLLGDQYSGSIVSSYWDISTTGQSSTAGGGLGYTTAQLQGLAPLSGNTYFSLSTNLGDNGSTWGGGANGHLACRPSPARPIPTPASRRSHPG